MAEEGQLVSPAAEIFKKANKIASENLLIIQKAFGLK